MRRCWAAAALLAVSSCAPPRPVPVPPPGVASDRSIALNGHTLHVHAADRRTGVERPLVVYATGDRGWAGKDLDVFRHLVDWGYPVGGFDAHDYVKHLGESPTTTPERLADDFKVIIRTSRDALQLPANVPVILVGVSRGAGLSVVAAGPLRAELRGVVAVALTREEEYVKWFHRIGHHRAVGTDQGMVQLYDYLPQLRGLPITVIQSTQDKYLPAAEALRLFGPEGPGHHFVSVDARNHSFAGARSEMYDALRAALHP